MASKRAVALSISKEVREEIYERDSWDGCPCCATCGKPGRHDISHIRKRSHGGLGIAQNAINQCRTCHSTMEHGKPQERADLLRQAIEYLQYRYPEWDENKLVYTRGY